MVTLLQIGGLINLEERSGSFLPELPYTNRGVIRQKEELSALIDWCQITIKEVPLEAVIEDVLRIPLELMTVTGYEKGIAGHEVVAIFDNIPSLTVRKRKNRCIPCGYWAAAIFAVVTDYSILFFPFTFFLNISHFTFCYELIICSETTDVMKIIRNSFSFV